MKNKVWVAISFSMLAAASTSVAQAEGNQAPKGSNEASVPNAEDTSVLLKALKVGKSPTFENAVPCYNTK